MGDRVRPGEAVSSHVAGLIIVPRLSRPSASHPHLPHVAKGRGISSRLQQRRLSPSETLRPVQRWKVHHREEARVRPPPSLPRPAPISLSWGHFSTVWLVKDSLYVSFISLPRPPSSPYTSQNRHSALKIVKSAGRYSETARDEIKLLRQITNASPTHPGRPHIVAFLDSFTHTVSSTSHICITLEPLGANLLSLIEKNRKKGVPPCVVKSIARQVLLGLRYLHDECDLVHTDIKPENISQ